MKPYALIINYRYCSGCHSCEVACRSQLELGIDEWGIKLTEVKPMKLGDKWEWNYIPVPTHLCDMCVDRIGQGKDPACVQNCLANCMKAVPVDRISEEMQSYGETVMCYLP